MTGPAAPSRTSLVSAAAAALLLLLDAPAWAALGVGMALALASGGAPPAWAKTWSTRGSGE